MADIYILDMGPKQDSARCAFHIAIPDQNNFAGVNYRTALTQYLDSTTSAVPGLDGTTQGNLDSGALYEHVETVRFNGNATNANKWAAIQSAYTSRKAAILSTIQNRLEFWGYSGNEE